MADRATVLKGLERCAGIDCTGCPYQRISPCQNKLVADALALLREQEPRVLTEEELKRIEPDSVYWGEGYFVRNLWPMAFTAEAIQDLDSGYLRDSYGRDYELDLYNKNGMGWRIWTARPGDEVRKAGPWDAEP